MLTHLHVYIHVYNMYECNEDPDETAQTQFPEKNIASNIYYVNFPNIPRSNIQYIGFEILLCIKHYSEQ